MAYLFEEYKSNDKCNEDEARGNHAREEVRIFLPEGSSKEI
jgi:hypothetical protein